jgi:hypothetical protein
MSSWFDSTGPSKRAVRTINAEAHAEMYRDAIDVLTSHAHLSDGRRELVGLLAQLAHDWELERDEPITGRGSHHRETVQIVP